MHSFVHFNGNKCIRNRNSIINSLRLKTDFPKCTWPGWKVVKPRHICNLISIFNKIPRKHVEIKLTSFCLKFYLHDKAFCNDIPFMQAMCKLVRGVFRTVVVSVATLNQNASSLSYQLLSLLFPSPVFTLFKVHG